jgi:serine/threonine protein phosphatase 1
MSYWRPSSECIYVIGDIHGNSDCLDAIFKRILPLRKNDELIFLGDYIDRGPDSYGVIDRLAKLSKEYKDQVVALLGNHEWLMLAALGLMKVNIMPGVIPPHAVWLANGGLKFMDSYADMAGMAEEDRRYLTTSRLLKLIPQDHIDFLLNTSLYYETADYLFVHAGCDPNQPIENQTRDQIIWDRSLHEFAIRTIGTGQDFDWDNKTIVCGHNYDGPIIHPKYMMIDCSGMRKLLCVELNSMEGYYASPRQNRLVKADLKDTTMLNLKHPKFKKYFE